MNITVDQKIKNSLGEKARFILVGGTNTAIDFGILFALKALGLNPLIANVVSTGTAFVFSFFANKKFTFQSEGGDLKKQMLLFTLVTLFGLWGIQTLIINTLSPLIAPLGFGDDITLLAAKLAATVASLIWNYVLYSRIVFKKQAE